MPAHRTDPSPRGYQRLRLRVSPPDPSSPTSRSPLSTPPRPSGLPSVSSAVPSRYTAQNTALIRAGYTPAWDPNERSAQAGSTPTSDPSPSKRRSHKSTMAEPRARVARHKGQMNFASERELPLCVDSTLEDDRPANSLNQVRLLLLAYGDPSPHPSFPAEPLPETVRVLDEIVTDFILELCHGAAQVAHHARRQKIKVDDFRFALRRDPNKLGRVQELLRMERELKEARKAFDQNDDQVAKDAGKKGAAALEEIEGSEAVPSATGTKKSKGKGKRAAAPRRESDATEESVPKKRKTIG
ncbi:Transcription initiation factor TFIID subunit 13 [Penicillium hispanicum]|uniref:Transcription initiation factor TFIID subunit 13 n=1 Tax=Penicillium hispanicum TaxID=1080232 RepID=UPI0025423A9D|nr:Transcription initiation factor TFIID subunit 13 [Penicillium hispanicum]KAJ5587877.1 Transcription initiation factor TFIID subunit 13 [Penicillium hispanicum]